MDVERHVMALRTQLIAVAATGDEVVRSVADALVTAMDPAVRLVLLEALSDAAGELSRELAPATVDVRLRGRDPELVVTGAPTSGRHRTSRTSTTSPTSRTTLRIPAQLKARVDSAAAQEGVSVNTWLVRAVAGALDRGDRRPAPPEARTTQARRTQTGERFTGWAR